MNVRIPQLALVALIGPSGSGKSSFSRRHFLPTEVISSDFCRGLVSDDENNQSASADAFDVLYAEPMTSLDAVLMVPDGVDPPEGLVAALGETLQESGWQAPDPSKPSGLPAPGMIVAIRDFWEGLN